MNVTDAAAKGALLPLLVFVVPFGAAASALAPDARDRLVRIAEAVTDVMVRLVHGILRVAPFGVFSLAASLTATAGWTLLQNLALFIGAVLAGLLTFYALVYLSAVRVLGKMSALAFPAHASRRSRSR